MAGRSLSKNDKICYPKPDFYNINAYTKFSENRLMFSQVIARKQKYKHVAGRQLCQNWQNLPINNPKPLTPDIHVHAKFE